MSEIPDDVMKGAAAILHQYENEPDDQIIVALAIMAEREACATIADEVSNRYMSGSSDYVFGYADGAEGSAIAIRSPRP